MKDNTRLKDYLSCVSRIAPLSEADLRLAVSARHGGDERAGRLLEERFLPAVVRWVLPYRGRGMELEDLIQLGNRGLLRGLKRLRPETEAAAEDILECCVIEEVESIVLLRH